MPAQFSGKTEKMEKNSLSIEGICVYKHYITGNSVFANERFGLVLELLIKKAGNNQDNKIKINTKQKIIKTINNNQESRQ